MIEVVLQAQPEGEISILSITGLSLEDCSAAMDGLNTYLLNTVASYRNELSTEHYVRVNRRMMVIVGYLQDHLQHSLRSWRVILLRQDGPEYSRIECKVAGVEEDHEQPPPVNRPSRYERSPVI
jgi:hypothetical protein